MVKIFLGNTQCRVVGLDPYTVAQFQDQMSYQVPGHQFMNRKGWDGTAHLFKKDGTFPSGFMDRAQNILHQRGLEFEIIEYRKPLLYGTPLGIDPDSGFTPRDYQLEAVERACNTDRGVIRISTGGGKTACIAMIAAQLDVPTVIYVIGIELLYQMKSTLEWLYPGIEVGMVGDGHCDIKKITICTLWSAAQAFGEKITLLDNDATQDSARKNKKSFRRAAVQRMVHESNLMIVDECQYVPSASARLISEKSLSARHAYLFSATPWRETGDDILIEAVGGPKIYDLSATDLIKMDYLVPAEFHFLDVPGMYRVGKTYPEVYDNYVVYNPIRNGILQKATYRLVDAGRKPLILVVKRKHGEILGEMLCKDLRIASLDGRNKTKDRLSAIQDMKDGKLDALIASKIFDQGIDIPQLDALVPAGSGKCSGRALQRVGRVIRPFPGKTFSVVAETFDNVKYLRYHSKARIEIYETEPAFRIKRYPRS